MKIKSFTDRLFSFLGIILLSPAMLATALVIWMTMGRPVLFDQRRPGLAGKPFRIYKFRTMDETRDANGVLLPGKDRLTKLGKVLRKTSLDELPQLFNVLRGDMSLVGPRPLKMEYLEIYTPEQMRRHQVRPGITGWAQVNGRNAIDWEEKFKLDLWYVDNHSLWTDAKILYLTAMKVFKRKGIHPPGQMLPSRLKKTS